MAGLTDIARRVADEQGLAPSWGQKVTSAVFAELRARLENLEEIVIPGLGRFHLKTVGAKKLHAFGRRRKVTIREHKCPAWQPAPSLKALVREKTEAADG